MAEVSSFEAKSRQRTRGDAESERRRKAEDARAEFALKQALAGKLTEQLEREGLADLAFAAARRVATEVLLGNVPIRHGQDAAATIKTLVEVGRLELGEATGSIDLLEPGERKARVQAIRDAADKRLKREQGAEPSSA